MVIALLLFAVSFLTIRFPPVALSPRIAGTELSAAAPHSSDTLHRRDTSVAADLTVGLSCAPHLGCSLSSRHTDDPIQRSTEGKVTVVITGYQSGLRHSWLHSTIGRYLMSEFDELVDRVILVWNNPNMPCPVQIEHVKFAVLSQPSNSLNHRWTATLPYIRTAAVFNLDDDVFVARSGLRCMLQWWRADRQRLVAPYVRLIHSNNSYVMDDLRLGGRYSIALPRALLLSRQHLETYASSLPSMLRYVDEQEARCDDILLNAAVGNSTGKAPLRVLLPAESVVDHFANCGFGSDDRVGGLTMQANRAALRSECTVGIASLFDGWNSGLHRSSDAVASCAADGRPTALRHSLKEGEFAQMLSTAPCIAPTATAEPAA